MTFSANELEWIEFCVFETQKAGKNLGIIDFSPLLKRVKQEKTQALLVFRVPRSKSETKEYKSQEYEQNKEYYRQKARDNYWKNKQKPKTKSVLTESVIKLQNKNKVNQEKNKKDAHLDSLNELRKSPDIGRQ